MDSLNKTLNNLSLYEVKAYVRKAQNVVLNLTEMEAKVREATNNEPWGASSSLMQEIAAGTYNYREREEITNMIFRRFTEKSAHEWRQIYKALQLLEYLVKNGSERFVDDARANISIVQMLKSFHYIDSQGRDQGINVRNRTKQLLQLLNDENIIRQERKKARDNAKKFAGVAGGKSSINPNHRYLGALDDNDDDGDTYTNRVYGDGGVFGQRFEEPRVTGGSNAYEEYEVGDSSANNNRNSANRRSSKATTTTSNVNVSSSKASKQHQPQPDVDLFSFGQETNYVNNNNNNANGNGGNNNNNNDDDDDDDFDDFQSAVPTATTSPAATQKPLNANNLATLFAASNNNPTMVTSTNTAQTIVAPQFNTTAGFSNDFASFATAPQQLQQQQQQQIPTATFTSVQPIPGSIPSQPQYNLTASEVPKKKPDAFSGLFSSAKSMGGSSNPNTNSHPTPTPTLNGKSNSTGKTAANTNGSTNIDDLFGDSSAKAGAASSSTKASNDTKNDFDLLSF
ncbi:hypothetical protein PACTADRAFT_50379 [Pachysolen tannophilus NRRL Y-2460]|uniref:ENTH domain-containing protein n=1 Tax=Pachysolen tannophilus NRRL Y-2460 TaxID=669874 RepID=A0A1E4TV76_PACTA|nr:hypothetical protein PACTADRAFT_50379 [Pachysolen tannophilus NRRL Y-2460]